LTQKTENETIFFSLTNFSWESYNKLPKFIQETIAKSKEWPGILRNFPQTGQSEVAMQEEQGGVSQYMEEENPFD